MSRKARCGDSRANCSIGAGASASHADIVVDHLLEADAMGLRSHGFMRVPQYLAEIASAEIDPAAAAAIASTAPGRAEVDGGRGFGQVVGSAMADEAIRTRRADRCLLRCRPPYGPYGTHRRLCGEDCAERRRRDRRVQRAAQRTLGRALRWPRKAGSLPIRSPSRPQAPAGRRSRRIFRRASRQRA